MIEERKEAGFLDEEARVAQLAQELKISETLIEALRAPLSEENKRQWPEFKETTLRALQRYPQALDKILFLDEEVLKTLRHFILFLPREFREDFKEFEPLFRKILQHIKIIDFTQRDPSLDRFSPEEVPRFADLVQLSFDDLVDPSGYMDTEDGEANLETKRMTFEASMEFWTRLKFLFPIVGNCIEKDRVRLEMKDRQGVKIAVELLTEPHLQEIREACLEKPKEGEEVSLNDILSLYFILAQDYVQRPDKKMFFLSYLNIFLFREVAFAFSFARFLRELPSELWADWLEIYKTEVLDEKTEIRKVFLSVWEDAGPEDCPASVLEALDVIFCEEEKGKGIQYKIGKRVEGVLFGEEEKSTNPQLAQELRIPEALLDQLEKHQINLSREWPRVREAIVSLDEEGRKTVIEKILFNVDNEFVRDLMRGLNVLPATRREDVEELRDFWEQIEKSARRIDGESQRKWEEEMITLQVILVSPPEVIMSAYVRADFEPEEQLVHGVARRTRMRNMKKELDAHYSQEGQVRLLFHGRAYLLPVLLGQCFNRDVSLLFVQNGGEGSKIQSGHILPSTLQTLEKVFFQEKAGEESMNTFLLLAHDYRNFSDDNEDVEEEKRRTKEEKKQMCFEYLSFLLYREGVSAYSFRHHFINFPQALWEDWVEACGGEKLLVGRSELTKVMVSIWKGTSKKQRSRILNQAMAQVCSAGWDKEEGMRPVLPPLQGKKKEMMGEETLPPRESPVSTTQLEEAPKMRFSAPEITHREGRNFFLSSLPEGVRLFVRWKEKTGKGGMSQPILCAVSPQREVILPREVILGPGRPHEICFFFVANKGSVVIPDPSFRTEMTLTPPRKEKIPRPISVRSANPVAIHEAVKPAQNIPETVSDMEGQGASSLETASHESIEIPPLLPVTKIPQLSSPRAKITEFSFEDQQELLCFALDEHEGRWEKIIEMEEAPDVSQDKPGMMARSFAFTAPFLQEIIETANFPRITVRFGTYKDISPEKIQKITPAELHPELAERLKRIAAEMVLPTYEFRGALCGLREIEPELLRLKKSSHEYARLWRMVHPGNTENPYQECLKKSWGFPSLIIKALEKFDPKIEKKGDELPKFSLLRGEKYKIHGVWNGGRPEAEVAGEQTHPSLLAEIKQWGTLIYQAHLGYFAEKDIQRLREESYKKIQRKTRESTWGNIINNEGRTPEYDQWGDNLIGVRKKRTRKEMEEERGDVLIQDLKFLFPDNRGIDSMPSIALSASAERYEHFRYLLREVERNRKYFIARIISTAKEVLKEKGLNGCNGGTYKKKEPIHCIVVRELLVALSEHLPILQWECLGKINGNGNGDITPSNGGAEEKKIRDLLSEEHQIHGKHWVDYLVDEMEKAEIPIGIHHEITVLYDDLENEAIQQRWEGTENME